MTSTRVNALGELPPYSVRCIHVDPAAEADGHQHVTAIETTDPDGGETRWSLVQVIEAVRNGERFVSEATPGGQGIELGPLVCPRCSVATLSAASGGSEVSLERCS